MSRIGKQLIEILKNVEVSQTDGVLAVKGPLGELKRKFLDDIEISIEGGNVSLKPKNETLFSRALWGTYASHIVNMIKGVSEGYEKKLVIEGVGYKSDLQGKELTLNLGFSHPIKMIVPEGIKITIEKNKMTIFGVDKEQVGATAAKIRSFKKPEPYKGKGIRYENEVVRRKVGKKAATAA